MSGVNRDRLHAVRLVDQFNGSSSAFYRVPRDRERASAVKPTLQLARSHTHYIGDTLLSAAIRARKRESRFFLGNSCGYGSAFLQNSLWLVFTETT